MPYLLNTLKSWTAAGNRIADFSEQTGLSPSACSLLFSGKRNLAPETLAGIIDKLEPKFAADILRSWLLDHIDTLPVEWKDRVSIIIKELNDRLQEETPEENTDHAKAWAVQSMERDPQFMELIRNFWKMVGSPKN